MFDLLWSVFYVPVFAGPFYHLTDLNMKKTFPRQAIMNEIDSIIQRIFGNVETLLIRRNPLKLRKPPIKKAIYPAESSPAMM